MSSEARLSSHKPSDTLAPQDTGEAMSDALFLSIGEGAIVIDSKGNVDRVNDAALGLLGYKANEIIGKWYPDVVIAEDEAGHIIPNMNRPVTEAFLSGRAVFRKVFYHRKDGSKVAVALTVSPILIDHEPVGAIEVFRDITKDVELENSKNEFISIASHQLRTPATGVKQYIGMLLQGYGGELTSKQLGMLQMAYESNERQLTIINDLLKVAQADANQVKPRKKRMELVSLINEIVEEQAEKFRRDKQILSFSPNDEVAWCTVDPTQIRMVIENIIDNAHKYTPAGKQVSVGLRTTPNYVTVSVKDQGVGISKKDISKLYQKFSRIDNPRSIEAGGTGLGLFWANKLVGLHGGKISVKSKPDEGTTFTIKLPRG